MFKSFKTEDKAEIEKFTVRKDENCCEFTFYNLFLWQQEYNNRYYHDDENLFIRVGKSGKYIYTVPFGDMEKGFLKLCRISGKNYPDIWGQEGPAFQQFKALYGKYYEITELRDEFDYLYLREDLINLSGKKYHSKRNHISAFSKRYDWHFENVTDENIYEVKECAKKWYNENREREDEEMQTEEKGVNFLLEHYKDLGIKGGLIRANGKVVAFTFGGSINGETFDIYIEKALSDYAEAYTIINREFALSLSENYKYINREDDLGLEGLRKAKLSYHPYKLIKKYYCTEKDIEKARKIYNEAFKEDKKFDDLLFENFTENLITLKENGKTVSILFKIPCELNGKKIYYIYAAATEKAERKKGYMSKLLKRVREESDAPLFLVPEDKELVAFYEKEGFYKAEAVEKGGEIKISVTKKQEQLSMLCDSYSGKFDIMFSYPSRQKVYEFPFAMR